eukprot:TRINITY_DN4025_c0_g1_i1.p1 TRINITY_DN4025_c0_g1~~TRINITY_DN4025_c0_g1_i1.p1  ORF type:complete len:134 (+),score=6.57 TRINITY_DN4025_c0_g1_i1:228-629(+)
MWVSSTNPFSSNSALQFFFILKLIYFALSAVQIRYGYPQFDKHHNRITRRTSSLRVKIFKLYRLIPFLFELRVLLDWICTKTALDLEETFKLEDIYATVYELKCDLLEWYEGVRGEIQSKKDKCTSGTLMFCS